MKGKALTFEAIINKFDNQGEKTGWRYIEIPPVLAQQLFPGNKKSFRVKGLLDGHVIKGVALLPMGDGDFILPINATMRKGTKKSANFFINSRRSRFMLKRYLEPRFLSRIIDTLLNESASIDLMQKPLACLPFFNYF